LKTVGGYGGRRNEGKKRKDKRRNETKGGSSGKKQEREEGRPGQYGHDGDPKNKRSQKKVVTDERTRKTLGTPRSRGDFEDKGNSQNRCRTGSAAG